MIVYEVITNVDHFCGGEYRELYRKESDAIKRMHEWVKEVTVNMDNCLRVNEITKHGIDIEWIDDYPAEYDDDTVLYGWARVIKKELL